MRDATRVSAASQGVFRQTAKLAKPLQAVNFHQHGPLLHRRPGRRQHPPHAARRRRPELVLHLHRLHHDEALSGRHLVPANHSIAPPAGSTDTGAAPSHETGFAPVGAQRAYALTDGADTVEVPFQWTGADGVSIRRTYTFTRGHYAVQVRDEVVNAGSQPWLGYVYRQLVRVPPVIETGFTKPESYSFHGAAWFSTGDKFEKRKFDDFIDDGPLDKSVTGGWIGMLQHHFFAAWIPGATDESRFSIDSPRGAGGQQQALIRELGPGLNVAPGASASTSARLWVGPKLVGQIESQQVPGLERAVDFSSYGVMAWLAGLLFSVLSFLHGVFGNWGWAIIGLVVIIKALMFPLSAAQYKSAAKMRRFQPRIEQLKERYGDD